MDKYEHFSDSQLQSLAQKGNKRAELALQKRRERIYTDIPDAIKSIIADIEHEIESWIGFHPYGEDYVTHDSPYAENYYKYNILEFASRRNATEEYYASRRNAIENPNAEDEDSEFYQEEETETEEEDSELTQEERLEALQEEEDEEIQAINEEQDEEERDISTARAESNELADEAIGKLLQHDYESALVLLEEAITEAPDQEWHSYPDMPFEAIHKQLRNWIEENIEE